MPKPVIFHGIKISDESPRKGREDHDLWIVTRANTRYWDGKLTDWTACFDTHTLEPMGLWPGLRKSREQTLEWYATEPANGRPIYMNQATPDVPASLTYPLAEVQRAIPIDEGDGFKENRMFGCMTDYLFGLALLQRRPRIVLNGVGMSHDAGHQYLHRSVLYWIGFCRGLGIEVVVEGASCYRNAGRQLYAYERYGYEELDELMKTFGNSSCPDSDLAALQTLVQSWRTMARSSPQCADELDHVLAVLQRLNNRPIA